MSGWEGVGAGETLTVISACMPSSWKPAGAPPDASPSTIVMVPALGEVTDVSSGSAAFGVSPVVAVPPGSTAPPPLSPGTSVAT